VVTNRTERGSFFKFSESVSESNSFEHSADNVAIFSFDFASYHREESIQQLEVGRL